MMDIRPLIAASDPLNRDLRSLHSVFVPRESSTMIIDATSHSASMPVSPKQGETITADSLTKQEPQLVSSSLTPTSWEHMSSSQKTSSLSSSSPLPTSTVLSQSWTSTSPRSSSPSSQVHTVKDALEVAEKFQASQINNESHCESWNGSNGALKTPSSAASSPHHPPSPGRRKGGEDNEEQEEHPSTAMTTSSMSARNCDRPDSSPSPQSQLNSSFDDGDTAGADVNMQTADSFGTSNMNLDGSFERRSRRKPTIEDIVRRVRPPVDAPPYDSEESEIEDEILNDEMMAKMRRENANDEVDGSEKPTPKLDDDEEGYKVGDDLRQFSANRLSRLEAVDGIEDDDEEMEMRSESDSNAESDRHTFLKDVPFAIYNLMHEVKVNAHAMFMKTASSLPPAEAKARREQYLLQLLSNLRDRCLEDGLKQEVIGAILKDVENEVTLLSEDFEDMKMKQYFSDSDKHSGYNGIDATDEHFLSKPDEKREDGKEPKVSSSFESSQSSNLPSFFNTISTASSLPPSSLTSSSSPTRDSKPIIVTVSADIKPPPPLISATGGLPPLHPLASSISETAFSPNMFGNAKLGSWFPGNLGNMPLYPFSPGGPLDHALARKFLPFEGKMGDSVDKDYLKCQYCERTFRRQKNLENHVESTHQGKGPHKPRRETNDMYFKCSHCPYTTKHQSNLYVHLRIHTGERPYICGACGVQYSQSHSLKSHIINKHDGIMSYYIKEKRTRSPRGMGYLSTQVMHDNSIFKVPPPLLPPSMPHNNLDLVNKAIEIAKSEHAQQQQQLKQHQQHLSPHGHDSNGSRGPMMAPPPLTSNGGNPTSSSNPTYTNSNTPSSNAKSPATPNSGSSGSQDTPTLNNSMFSTPGSGPPHFFMNGHQMSPLMFGELPPHIRNPGHMGGGHHPSAPHLFPGFPHFPPHSSATFHGAAGMSPLSGLSPNSSSASSTPNSHPSLPPHLQLPVSMPPHLTPSPLPLMQQQQIKKEPQAGPTTPVSSKQGSRFQSDEAMDLRKKSPPLDSKDQHAHDLSTCGGKENCAHAAKLKYLRLNVVRMLGILVPNLNFAEKGISAESESVDELLQDVIESNTHDDDMME